MKCNSQRELGTCHSSLDGETAETGPVPFLDFVSDYNHFVFLIIFYLSIILPSPADADVGSSPTCDTTGHLLLSFFIKPGCPDGQGSA